MASLPHMASTAFLITAAAGQQGAADSRFKGSGGFELAVYRFRVSALSYIGLTKS